MTGRATSTDSRTILIGSFAVRLFLSALRNYRSASLEIFGQQPKRSEIGVDSGMAATLLSKMALRWRVVALLQEFDSEIGILSVWNSLCALPSSVSMPR